MFFEVMEYYEWIYFFLKKITTFAVFSLSSYFVIKQLWHKRPLNIIDSTQNNRSVDNSVKTNEFRTILKTSRSFVDAEKSFLNESTDGANSSNSIGSANEKSISISKSPSAACIQSIMPSNERLQTNFLLDKLKSNDTSILISFAGETGMAERYASSLHKDLRRVRIKSVILPIDSIHYSTFTDLCIVPKNIFILFASTHGDGEPADVARSFYDWLHENLSLRNLNYTVFALGDRSYDRYNAAGKYFDKRLKNLGANNIYTRGESDASNQPEISLEKWKSGLVPVIFKTLGIDHKSLDCLSYKIPMNDYLMEIVDFPDSKIYHGEPYKIGTFSNQKIPHHMKNPFLAKVENWRELCNKDSIKSNKSVFHIELDLVKSSLRYEPGDHLGMFPSNDSKLVDWIGKLLMVNLDQQINLKPIENSFMKYSPFPCPTTIRNALLFYIDINTPLSISAIRDLVGYALLKHDRETLIRLANPFDKSFYYEWILKEHRNIVAVLEDLPSLRPPISLLLEILPKLQCRYYSIASSNKMHQNKVHLTVSIVEGITSIGRKYNGVCSGRLKSCCLNKDSKIEDPCGLNWRIPIFIKKSVFKLPDMSNIPLILICAGTGISSFRGFLQHRKVLKEEKPNIIIGDIMIFYGCQHEKIDYLYEKELISYKNDGIISNLYVAFSRDQSEKFYVTHLMKKHSKEIWKYLCRCSKIYVCGDASKLSKDVHETMYQVVCENGGLSERQASDYMKKLSSQGRYLLDVWTS